MLVQLCKKVAQIELVVGVVGGQAKVGLAKEMGCDYVICRKDKSGGNVDIWEEMKKQIPKLNGFDIVFDANGISTLKNSFKHLKPTGMQLIIYVRWFFLFEGKLIVYGLHSILPHTGSISITNWISLGFDVLRTPSFNAMTLLERNCGVLGFNLSFLFSRMDRLEEAMANLLTWISQKKITVSKVTTYKFEEVWKAHRDLQSGETTGKLVLQTVHNSNRCSKD
ncbi:hypothetical protein RFI_04073 [Reticulomyxa filosa]|uniref:Alcohol dehydrogenase-like C-terminal domain-containing protein n=1 Tax=Reticulomyxa filosa TaxID=46433 RepID=X6P481_RETFI|nr:hypothetical protein RFI_04073 [Reticulomyxa filosa]|eukprot:ETO33031.1 hypothetical protein RFI_04073 [Reticulomyxa filosa]